MLYKLICRLAGWLGVYLVDSLAWWCPLQRGDLVSSVTTDWCLASHRWGFYITHSDAPQLVGLLWWVISSSQRPLLDNTQHSQQTKVHSSGGIRSNDLSRQTAVELRLRPRGHWDRQQVRSTLLTGSYAAQNRISIPSFRNNLSGPILRGSSNPILAVFLGCLTIEDGTARLCRNVGKEIPLHAD